MVQWWRRSEDPSAQIAVTAVANDAHHHPARLLCERDMLSSCLRQPSSKTMPSFSGPLLAVQELKSSNVSTSEVLSALDLWKLATAWADRGQC